jgi:hypothetical protein
MRTTSSNRTTPGPLGRRLTSAVLAVGMFVGTIAATAQPAHAAGAVWGCFTLAGRPPTFPISVDLRVAVGNTWRTLNTYKTNKNGCVSIPVTLGYTGQYAILYAFDRNYGGTLYGWSGLYATPGSHVSNVGMTALQYSCAGIVSHC